MNNEYSNDDSDTSDNEYVPHDEHNLINFAQRQERNRVKAQGEAMEKAKIVKLGILFDTAQGG